MVKKLFKYEIAAYLRVWVPAQLILLVVALFGRAAQLLEADNFVYEALFSFTLIIYATCVIASISFTMIFAIIRYYRNLFTSQGYLSFTLPVSASQHIFVKTATAVLFNIASVIVAFISFIIISMGDFFVEFMKAVGYLSNIAFKAVGSDFVFYIIEAIVLLIIYITTSYMLYIVCITIGQKANKGRIGFAILAYGVIYVITQIIYTVIQTTVLFLPPERFEAIGKYCVKNAEWLTHIGLISLIVINVALALIYFFVSRRIIIKKLNLH